MKYLYLLPLFVLLLAIGIYFISTEVIKPFGRAISGVITPKKLISNLDYIILDEKISENNLIIMLKLFGNISNSFCIEEVKINNVTKDFEYHPILNDVYSIKIKDVKSYNKLQLWLCNGFLIEEP